VVIVLTDVSHMLQTYRTVVASHALQVYYSAKVTMPQCGLLELSQKAGSRDVPCLLSKRWDARGHSIFVFEADTGSVNSVAFSPDGTQIVLGSSDKTVRLWDARTV
jgi:WD40 repeat protein